VGGGVNRLAEGQCKQPLAAPLENTEEMGSRVHPPSLWFARCKKYNH